MRATFGELCVLLGAAGAGIEEAIKGGISSKVNLYYR